MSESQNQIEQMQRRLEQVAAREQLLIHALNQALAAADRRLLDDVRAVASDHEHRRSVILTELQSLASRIGAFPPAAAPLDAIEYQAVRQTTTPETPAPVVYRDEPAGSGGDWRKAAENIGKGLDFRLNGAEAPRTA